MSAESPRKPLSKRRKIDEQPSKSKLKKELKRFQDKLSMLEDDRKTLSDQCNSLADECNVLNAECKALGASSEQRIASNKQLMEVKERRLESKEKDMALINQEMASIKQTMASIKHRVENCERFIISNPDPDPDSDPTDSVPHQNVMAPQTIKGLDEPDGPVKFCHAKTIETLGSETKTPFVNRERELVELALHNAKLIYKMKENRGIVDNRRAISFVFAAQMYGAGKTRLGREFVTQLPLLLDKGLEVFQKYWSENNLPHLVRILHQFTDAKLVQILLSDSVTTFSSFLEDINVDSFANFLIDICDIAERPVFIHIDEVGSMPATELRQMRDECYKCVSQLGRSGHLKDSFPFFYFSGRGAPYDELGSMSSPIGSHWLILEPLVLAHVKRLIDESTYSGAKFSFLQDLSPEESQRVIEHIILWTAGAPRPLIYTMHMLNSLRVCHGNLYTSEEGLKVLFRALVGFIKDSTLKHDLGPISTTKYDDNTQMAYDYFCYLSESRRCIDKEAPTPFGENKASTYLRSLNIFATVRETQRIQLVSPAFVTHIVHKDERSFRNSLLFQRHSHSSHEQEIEFVVPDIILLWHKFNKWEDSSDIFPHIVHPTYVNGIKIDAVNVWQKRGPVIANNGLLTRQEIDKIVAHRENGTNTRQLSFIDLEYFCDRLKVGDIFISGKKSAAADAIFKIGEKFVIECQFKTGKQVLTLKQVEEEVAKSLTKHCKTYKSIFIIICASGFKPSDLNYPTNPRNMTVLLPKSQELKSFFRDEDILSAFQTNALIQ